MSSQDSLVWTEGTFGLEPKWTKEPNVHIISELLRRQLNLGHDISIAVAFASKGAFTKIYKISAPESAYTMRVSLPVDPINRTESAVATIEYARQQKNLAVPNIIAYSSNESNELGFEWMLMEYTPGTTLYKAWRKLSWETKAAMVDQLAEHQSRLFEHRFQKIGNLYRHDDGFVVDRLVSTVSYQGNHITNNTIRGPFTSSHEWLKARIQRILTEQQRIIDTSCDEDEIDDAEFTQNLAKQLFELLPTVFLPNPSASELTVLVHGSLSMHNIIVNGDGKISVIMDWECVSAMPLWRACRLPELFEERVREEMPLRDDYSVDSEEEDDKDDDGLDNEGITDMYWEHLLEYELTQLREVFLQGMEKRSPDWALLAKQGTLKDDFERAVEECDNGWRNNGVKRWVDMLAEGEPGNLAAMLFSYPGVDQLSQTSMDWEEA